MEAQITPVSDRPRRETVLPASLLQQSARAENHAIGSSLTWYRGKDDWLFLGNAYNDTVAKLKLSITPSSEELDAVEALFVNLSSVAVKSGTKVVLILGPNKASVYPEYLPPDVKPSSVRYSSFFLDKLRLVPNLVVHDPTEDLLRLKEREGILYWMTDTHWNPKGAFLAFSGMLNILGLPVPQVEFRHSGTHSGDLIGISKLENFPLHAEDNWQAILPAPPVWKVTKVDGEESSTFGSVELVENDDAPSEMSIWVVGDSFTGPLKPYFNSAFGEVHYLGHWSEKLSGLPAELEKAAEKPDFIFVVRVERSF